jgi:hypothetical protein
VALRHRRRRDASPRVDAVAGASIDCADRLRARWSRPGCKRRSSSCCGRNPGILSSSDDPYIENLSMALLQRKNLFPAPLAKRIKNGMEAVWGWRRDATPNDHSWLPPCEDETGDG